MIKEYPKCGQIVHYYTIMPDFLKGEHEELVLPAIVVLGGALYVHLKVFEVLEIRSALNVPHASVVERNEKGEPKYSYWDFA